MSFGASVWWVSYSLSLSLRLSNKKRTKIPFEFLVCNQKYNIRNLEFESHQISSRLFGLCFLFLCIDRQQKLCQTPLKKKNVKPCQTPSKKKFRSAYYFQRGNSLYRIAYRCGQCSAEIARRYILPSLLTHWIRLEHIWFVDMEFISSYPCK